MNIIARLCDHYKSRESKMSENGWSRCVLIRFMEIVCLKELFSPDVYAFVSSCVTNRANQKYDSRDVACEAT